MLLGAMLCGVGGFIAPHIEAQSFNCKKAAQPVSQVSRLGIRYPSKFKTVFEKTYVAGGLYDLYVRKAVPDGETDSNWSAMILLTSRLGAGADRGNSPSGYAWNMYSGYREACPSTSSVVELGSQQFNGYPGFSVIASCGSMTPDSHSETVLIVAIKGPSDMYTIEWMQRGPRSDHAVPIATGVWRNRLKQLEPIRICP
jgi:hypothetical protein